MTRILSALLLCSALLGVSSSGAQAAELITEKFSHSVIRSDSSETTMEKNEFYRGSHTFFAEFKENKVSIWIDTKLSSYKSGWSRLYLDWPVRLSAITIHKASAKKKEFKGGHIKLEVQSPKGKWITVFERQDDDVDKPVTIRKELSKIGLIKGAKISFRSPGPITIGPIDLYK